LGFLPIYVALAFAAAACIQIGLDLYGLPAAARLVRRWSASKLPPSHRARLKARIVLMALEGAATRAIGRALGFTIRTTSKVAGALRQGSPGWLSETGNRGAKAKYGEEAGGRILALLDQPPPASSANWTWPLIAASPGDVHVQQVRRFLLAHNIVYAKVPSSRAIATQTTLVGFPVRALAGGIWQPHLQLPGDIRDCPDPDIPYPNLRFERAELMRSRTKRIASWPVGFGLASTGRTYDRNRQRDVAEENACHIWSGLRSPPRPLQFQTTPVFPDRLAA
jgi:hypothetical protein